MVLTMGKIKFFMDYFKFLKNPIPVLRFKLGLSNSCFVKVKKTDYEIQLTSEFALNKLMGSIQGIADEKLDEFLDYIVEIDKNNKFVTIGGVKFLNVFNSDFKQEYPFEYSICNEEYFLGDDWDMIDVSGRTVIDIGGNDADTALYFAKRGAKVLGFEPVKHLYDLAIKNISINPELSKNIVFINKAVGAKQGKLDIIDTVEDYVNDDVNSYEIEVITIEDVLNDYEVTPDILKMDCEGCEFGIIENSDLTMFNEIVFEHHTMLMGKDYNILINKLKSNNFKIKTYPISTQNFEDVGLIYAYK